MREQQMQQGVPESVSRLRVRTVEILPGEVILIDQAALPHEERRVHCHTWQHLAECITDMTVRGAPAIGVAAAGGLMLAGWTAAADGAGMPHLRHTLETAAHGLLETRPTAVNLRWAVDEMRAVWESCGDGPQACADALLARAQAILADDVDRCLRIGAHGAPLFAPGARILTHCNAGALATAGYGTALGVIRSAYAQHPDISVWVDETRPWLQGARLTAWELAVEGIPFHVISDNMAGHFFSRGEIDGVVVGADRIAANGDTANKIGTYQLAVLAAAHRIPFYVAAAYSTFDLRIKDGNRIPIEERAADEVRSIRGTGIAPAGFPVANPAFDVTPVELIAAFVTDRGVIRRPTAAAIRKLVG
jgi:methylthioribose-1-phosphate isomerase